MPEEEIPAIIVNKVQIYSPASIINIFNNLILTMVEKRLIGMRGIYTKLGKQNYNGFWYDKLKDEASDNSITLKVPFLIRNKLEHGKTIEFVCFISKKVKNDGVIELEATVTDLLTQTLGKYSEEEIRAVEIMQNKSNQGYKDVDGFIKKSVYENIKPRIKIIIPKVNEIKDDISKQMAEAISLYDIEFIHASITSVDSIIDTIKSNCQNADIIIIARGGGKGLEIFNSNELAEYCIGLKPFLITALGHETNKPLLEKVADKNFITPTALGQYLKEIYNSTVEDFEKSKAKIIKDVESQLKLIHEKQIALLQKKLKDENELSKKRIEDENKLHKKQVADQKELFEKTLLETKKLRESESKLLNKQLEDLKKQIENQLKESTKNFSEKEINLNKQIEIKTKEKEELNNLYLKTSNLIAQYSENIDNLKKQNQSIKSEKRNLVVMAIVITAIITTLIILVLK